MNNAYTVLSQFEELCQNAAKYIKASPYKLAFILEKLGLAESTYRERVRNPKLWTVEQLYKLAELLAPSTKSGGAVV